MVAPARWRDADVRGDVSDLDLPLAPDGEAPATAEPSGDGPSTWRPSPAPGRLVKGIRTLRWLPALAWQRSMRRTPKIEGAHLLIAVADHFEPSFGPRTTHTRTSEAEQEQRVDRWCRQYRRAVDSWRDADGRPMVHTYFLPAEEYYPAVVERLAEFARQGYGEVEVHLHHGVYAPDTPENTRRTLAEFRDELVRFGCLSRWNGVGPARYAFVHGNWALANSAGGDYCGVDNEMQILADTGCYADLTLPSAPSAAQVSKINSIYECDLPLDHAAPHRRGRDLRVGTPPMAWPIVIQGPLGLYFRRQPGLGAWLPRVENGEVTAHHGPSSQRMQSWHELAAWVRGRPEWKFIKLHCHGLDPRDEECMTGAARTRFTRDLTEHAAAHGATLHFVTAREMVNIALAACDGREGDPSDYRDYRLQRITPAS